MSEDTSTSRQTGRLRALVSMTFTTRPDSRASDVALVVLRIGLAWIFIYYGGGKLFGWFHGPGIHIESLFMSQSAHLHPGGLFAVLGGVIELFGGIAMALGFGVRIAGLGLFGDQVMAMITVTWVNGMNSESLTPGYEFNVALAVMALAVVCLGAGRLSVDALIERRLRRANGLLAP